MAHDDGAQPAKAATVANINRPLSLPVEHLSDRLATDISAPRVACNDRGADRKPEGGPDDR